MPVLADGLVRFAGEKVAAVAAESAIIAERALERIEIEYEEFSPVFDPVEALTPAAPLLHPQVMEYKGLPGKLSAPSNAMVQLVLEKSEMSKTVFARRPDSSRKHFKPKSCTRPISNRTLGRQATESGGAEIWACSKVPFALRDQMATAFRHRRGNVLVTSVQHRRRFRRQGRLHGRAGGVSCFRCRAASRCKMLMDYRATKFSAGNHAHASIAEVKSGVSTDGRILAHQMDFVFDGGAYGAFKPIGYLFGAHEAAGPYRMANVLIEEKIVYTNKVPCGHMRAPGDPQGVSPTNRRWT
jgi:CO/xanthine dehydrogenase Mo-binding subunit